MHLPNSSEVFAQVERICQKRPLSHSKRGAQLVRYLLKALYKGRADEEIKESVIGVEVFDLPTDYNPKQNSIVRVTAAKLRKNLDRYYETFGRNDPLRIAIPVGTYIPKVYRIEVDAGVAISYPAAMCIANAKVALDQRTVSGYAQALKQLNQALAKHPGHPRILSLKAMAHAARAMYGGDPRHDLPAAAALIDEAKAHKHTPWERLLVEAWLKMTMEFDWAGAEPLFKSAIELSHGEASYHTWYTAYLFSQLRMEEGLALVESAVMHSAGDDHSFRRGDLALCQVVSGKLDEAAETLQTAFDLFPNTHYLLRMHEAILLEAKGDLAGAAAAIQKAKVGAEDSSMIPGLRCLFAGISGAKRQAQQEYRRLVALRKAEKVFVPALQLANAARGAGDSAAADQWFEQAIQERDPMLCWITIIPFTRHLHKSAKIRALISEQLKLRFPGASSYAQAG